MNVERGFVCFALSLLGACVFFEHSGGSGGGGGGGAGPSTTDTSVTTGPDGGAGGSCGINPPPPRRCGNLLQIGDNQSVCYIAAVNAIGLNTASPGGVAITSHAVIFAATSGNGVCEANETAIHRVPRDAEPSLTGVPDHGCIQEGSNAAGSIAAYSTPTSDVVFYSGQQTGRIDRCTFPLAGPPMCDTFVNIPAPGQHANGMSIRTVDCRRELWFATPTPTMGASFHSILLDEATPTMVPRYSVTPAPPTSAGGRFVKSYGSKLALGVYDTGDGSGAVIEQTVDGILEPGGSPKVLTLPGALTTSGVLFGMALNGSHRYARSADVLAIDGKMRNVAGFGAIDADDDHVFFAECAPATCNVGMLKADLTGTPLGLGSLFPSVGGIATDGDAAYFTVVPPSFINQVRLVRFVKDGP